MGVIPPRRLWPPLLPGRFLLSVVIYSNTRYDGDPAEHLHNLNAVLGEGFGNISQAYLDYGPEWHAKAHTMVNMDIGIIAYWCACACRLRLVSGNWFHSTRRAQRLNCSMRGSMEPHIQVLSHKASPARPAGPATK